MSMHITKLSLLFPCAHSTSPITTSLLPACSTFLTSFLLLRLLIFDHTPSLGSSQLLIYSGLLLVGSLLSVDAVFSPLWASLTHSLPSSSNLLGKCVGLPPSLTASHPAQTCWVKCGMEGEGVA
jgi:hypothetical protein